MSYCVSAPSTNATQANHYSQNSEHVANLQVPDASGYGGSVTHLGKPLGTSLDVSPKCPPRVHRDQFDQLFEEGDENRSGLERGSVYARVRCELSRESLTSDIPGMVSYTTSYRVRTRSSRSCSSVWKRVCSAGSVPSKGSAS
jgi:hypothetical protein